MRHHDALLDADKLGRLHREDERVAKTKKGGRYAKGERWEYLDDLRNPLARPKHQPN